LSEEALENSIFAELISSFLLPKIGKSAKWDFFACDNDALKPHPLPRADVIFKPNEFD
jgi:hypothetical protein